VRSVTDAVLLSKQGHSYCDGRDCYQNYSWEIGQAIREWNPKVSWRSKDLRNCLFTFFAIRGPGRDVTEQYLGHAPKSRHRPALHPDWLWPPTGNARRWGG